MGVIEFRGQGVAANTLGWVDEVSTSGAFLSVRELETTPDSDVVCRGPPGLCVVRKCCQETIRWCLWSLQLWCMFRPCSVPVLTTNRAYLHSRARTWMFEREQ